MKQLNTIYFYLSFIFNFQFKVVSRSGHIDTVWIRNNHDFNDSEIKDQHSIKTHCILESLLVKKLFEQKSIQEIRHFNVSYLLTPNKIK